MPGWDHAQRQAAMTNNHHLTQGNDLGQRMAADPSLIGGYALGLNGQAGVSYLGGIFSLGAGAYIDTRGGTQGLYLSVGNAQGLGFAGGVDGQVIAFTSVESFGGSSAGVQVDTPWGGASASVSPSGGSVSLSGLGVGLSVFAGVNAQYTIVLPVEASPDPIPGPFPYTAPGGATFFPKK